jgi:hypothetical protein
MRGVSLRCPMRLRDVRIGAITTYCFIAWQKHYSHTIDHLFTWRRVFITLPLEVVLIRNIYQTCHKNTLGRGRYVVRTTTTVVNLVTWWRIVLVGYLKTKNQLHNLFIVQCDDRVIGNDKLPWPVSISFHDKRGWRLHAWFLFDGRKTRHQDTNQRLQRLQGKSGVLVSLNPSVRTLALTQTSTRNLPWGIKAASVKRWQHCRLKSWQPQPPGALGEYQGKYKKSFTLCLFKPFLANTRIISYSRSRLLPFAPFPVHNLGKFA